MARTALAPPGGWLSRAVVELFFPAHCIGCGRAGGFLCPACEGSLPGLLPPLCPRCGLPQAVEPCPACHRLSLDIDGIRSPYRFEGLARRAVHLFKYENFKALAPVLGGGLVEYLSRHPLPGEVIVPVPLHPARLRERGYNQAELLARGLGEGLGLPVSPGALTRRRPTPPQARLTARPQRWQNMEGAFQGGNGVAGKEVLLVDDVATTGATLNAAARALKGTGAKRVWGLTWAREV